jgi:hypothetical protein
MTKKHISTKASKVIEESEGIPLASAKGIGTYVLVEVGQNGADGPYCKENFLLSLGGSFHPCREDGQIKIEAYQHINVPHVACYEAEGVW